MRIDTVEFDEHNEEHATRHGVSLVEIVQVFANAPEVRRNRRGRAAGLPRFGCHRWRVDPGRLRPRPRNRYRPAHRRMEDHMSSKNAEQTALAADDAYEHAVDPDDGDVVDVEASKNLTTVVSVRLSVEDLTLIEQAASRADVKLSAFLRNAALSVARDEEVISRSEAVAAVEAVEKALYALRGAAGQKKDRLLA